MKYHISSISLLKFFTHLNSQISFGEFFSQVFSFYKELFRAEKGMFLNYDHARDELLIFEHSGLNSKEIAIIYEHYRKFFLENSQFLKRKNTLNLKEEFVKINGDFWVVIPFYGKESLIFLIVLEAKENEISLIEEFFLQPEFQFLKQKLETSYEDIYAFKISQMKNKEMGALLNVGKVISGTLDLQELLSRIIDVTREVLDSEAASVFLYDEDQNDLYFYIVQGGKEDVLKKIRIPLGKGIAGLCAQNREPILVPDAQKDPRVFKEPDKKTKFVTKSLIAVPMVNKGKLVGVLEVLNKKGEIPYNIHDQALLETIASLAVNSLENATLYENIRNLYLSTIKVLSASLDAKDEYTQGHSERVAMYSIYIAEELGFTPKKLEELHFAGLLHDFGKIGIRDIILCKPGRLTDEEYEIIKTHPVKSAEILQGIDFFKNIIPMIRHHHERWDGKGYPDGLEGEEIPLEARIIAVADTFDAMTSHRAYRKGLPVEVALEEIKRCAGTQFDPHIAEVFIKVFNEKIADKFEEIRGEFKPQEAVEKIE